MAYRRTKKVAEKLQNRRQSIVRAGQEILAEEGYHNIAVKNIAEKAGIATGTFYLYFANKDKLVETIAEEMYQQLLERIRKARKKQTTVLAKLQASMETCVAIFSEEKHLAKILLVQIPGISKTLDHKLVDIENELIRLTKLDLDELMELGIIPQQNTYLSACALVGSFRQVILSWLRQKDTEDLAQVFPPLFDYNLRGLGKYE